jgi:hypothetical protein
MWSKKRKEEHWLVKDPFSKKKNGIRNKQITPWIERRKGEETTIKFNTLRGRRRKESRSRSRILMRLNQQGR